MVGARQNGPSVAVGPASPADGKSREAKRHLTVGRRRRRRTDWWRLLLAWTLSCERKAVTQVNPTLPSKFPIPPIQPLGAGAVCEWSRSRAVETWNGSQRAYR